MCFFILSKTLIFISCSMMGHRPTDFQEYNHGHLDLPDNKRVYH